MEPFEPVAITLFTILALAVIMALEHAIRELSLEYGGGAGVATGLAVLGVGRPTEELLRYGLPYVALKRGSIPKDGKPPLGILVGMSFSCRLLAPECNWCDCNEFSCNLVD